jgi:hypothetical protein
MEIIKFSSLFISDYLKEAKPLVQLRLSKLKKYNNDQTFRKLFHLVSKNIDEILIGLPDDLADLAQKIDRVLNNSSKKKKSTYRKRFSKVFNYTAFCKKSKRTHFYAYTLLKETGLRVCPYCDENFILFLESSPGRKSFRGPLDHYIPKSIYPYFAVSLFNLVPSCSSCNSLKHERDTVKHPLINPYRYAIGDSFEFVIIFDKITPSYKNPPKTQAIKLIKTHSSPISDVYFKNYKRCLHLNSRYKSLGIRHRPSGLCSQYYPSRTSPYIWTMGRTDPRAHRTYEQPGHGTRTVRLRWPTTRRRERPILQSS